jgi:hypothetical protein
VIQTFFWNVSNIDHRFREPEEHAGSITVPYRRALEKSLAS